MSITWSAVAEAPSTTILPATFPTTSRPGSCIGFGEAWLRNGSSEGQSYRSSADCAPPQAPCGADHKEVAKGTLRAIIKQAGLTVEEFNALFK